MGGAVIGPDSGTNRALWESRSLWEIPYGITASAASTTSEQSLAHLRATAPPAMPGFL